MFRRLKSSNELAKDPDFLLRLGQLVGAASMAGYVLSNAQNPDAQLVGDKLSSVADWFYEKG